MTDTLEEIILEGAPISGGIAIGSLFFLEGFQEEIVPEFSIPTAEVEKEIGRYRRAVHSSREDLHDLQRFLAKEGSSEAVSIIDTHIQMLEDPFMTTFMEKKIRQRMKNTETVFRSVMVDYEKEFSKVKDNFFKQRLLDVKDLSQRILRNLHPRKALKTEDIPDNSIIFTKELVPSSIAEASKGQVKGFVTEIGGTTSHAALIARSKGVPYVANISIDALFPYKGSPVIIDGKTGTAIVNPSKATLDKYQSQQETDEAQKVATIEEAEEGIQTKDGAKVTVFANIENLSDLDLLGPYKAEGIGLFRSEFLFFGKELETFSEEDQFVLYQQVMEKAKGMPVIFRTFDVGGDKGNVNLYEEEPNPALGCRGIRFLLRNKEIFVQQLRALLRVSLDGDLRILLPMISDVSELLESKELLQEAALQLRSEGHEIADEIPIGCMIEVPSAVMTCDHLASACDFLSIGTNDLTQYTLAADRATQDVQPFYKPLHPSILRMIKRVVEASEKQEIPVSLCGEMASNPLMTPLLLGLGVRKFSCASRYIPQVKKVIAQLSTNELRSLAEEALSLHTAEEVETFLSKAYGDLTFDEPSEV
ncbi:phosphoenolpyruvate--protein phosphotransferase [Candidatus Neptunochlamydia vexilliferae]|uniref:Phosphoenolpyruvate-protein phosphotransferase n=1 Tax=Candidatus Neptunichlamydia vexilliferae TaxID=1651774 RepID=A0ABS0B0H8_9BACT|nr:phosphoenolpyruvate--protein phosphotransferase [Candidatus Neptunochlamydia vexilliferae]MBF5059893.1 Phosphoenolpyruvate-protein phosphotransferase [Candidatus Neptunochlamydia vexilliferae]